MHTADYKQLKSLVEDLFELRREKAIRLLKSITPEESLAVYLNNIGCAELNYVRPSFTSAMSIAHKMQ